MNIFADQNSECWGAMDFVDEHMEPITKTLIIESTGMGSPPGGGEPKVYFIFKGDKRKAFLNKTSKLVIANALRTMNGDEVKGAYLKITSGMVKNRKASTKRPEIPKEIMGMMVIAAAYPKGKEKQNTPPAPVEPPAEQQPTEEHGDTYEGP
jgi:hypothetical protein